jgi:hypothetical protein
VPLIINYYESGLIQPTDEQINDSYKVNPFILSLIEESIYKTVDSEDTNNMIRLDIDDFTIINQGNYRFNFNNTEGCFYNANSRVSGLS